MMGPYRRQGGLVINMKWRQLFPSAIVIFAAAAIGPSTALAQDRLASIITKQKLTRQDIAQIEAEVPERARKLADAASNERERTRARERLLSTARTQGATKAALDVYAEVCSKELESAAASQNFTVGFDAVGVLIELDHPNASGALAKGLTSPHAAVRYRAARGLRLLQSKFKDDESKCRTIIRALAAAGATERDPAVLGMIYQAINFYPDVPDFKFGDESARALNVLLEGRLKRLREGGLDESLDLPAFDLAVACHAAAAEPERIRLAQHLAPFLSHAVLRYLDGHASEEQSAYLSTVVKRMEESMHALIKSSKKSVPKTSLASELASKSAPERKRQAVRAALDELSNILKGEPWNLR